MEQWAPRWVSKEAPTIGEVWASPAVDDVHFPVCSQEIRCPMTKNSNWSRLKLIDEGSYIQIYTCLWKMCHNKTNSVRNIIPEKKAIFFGKNMSQIYNKKIDAIQKIYFNGFWELRWCSLKIYINRLNECKCSYLKPREPDFKISFYYLNNGFHSLLAHILYVYLWFTSWIILIELMLT